STTHCREERFKTEKNTAPKTAAEFDRYAADWTGQNWGLPVRLFSRASFESLLADSGLEIATWRPIGSATMRSANMRLSGGTTRRAAPECPGWDHPPPMRRLPGEGQLL